MKPVIYQVFPRYWGPYQGRNVRSGSITENSCGHFGDFDDASLRYLKKLGVSHVWYTGVLRHATSCDTNGCTPSHPQIVKGAAGSPYAITDFFDVNPYLAAEPEHRMAEFAQLVERTHQHGLKVIIDFVPNHVSRDNVNLGADDDKTVHWRPENDFFYYPGQALTLPTKFKPTARFRQGYVENPARATGNDCFSANPGINDWYETVKINYCDFHTVTWDKMLAILLFWAERGVDGFRCDMVEMVPPEFFSWAIARVKEQYPDVEFIAEVYDKNLYHKYIYEVGFDLLYDKSGLYDALHDIVVNNTHDKDRGEYVENWQSVRRITSCWQQLENVQSHMLNFLENHDEIRLASRFFAGSAAGGYAALAVSALLTNSAFMIYSGQEIGEDAPCSEGFRGDDGRSTIFDWWKSDSASALWEHVHGGKVLNPAQKLILRKYTEILKVASRMNFSQGQLYDLNFCNVGSQGFDSDRHYAFLRFDAKACTLVVCNFSDKDSVMSLNLLPLQEYIDVQVAAHDYLIINL